MARKAGSHGDITGPAIQNAASALFAKSGFAAVSMRQIAGAVGLQAGALYLYTPDKQTLLFDLMRTHLDGLMAAWEAADPGGRADLRLGAFVRFHVDYHLDRPEAVTLAYMELRNLTEENFKVIEALRRAYEAVLEGILTDGVEAGLFHVPDVRITAMAIVAMLTGPNVWFREDGRLTRDEIQTMYGDLVQRMVIH